MGRYMNCELKKHGYTTITSDIRGNVDVFLDIMDQKKIENVLTSYNVDSIINLAGFSSVLKSWQKPSQSFELNVNGSINIMSAVKKVNSNIKILLVGSSQEYGPINDLKAVDEKTFLNPQNPYAISKYAQETMALSFYRNYGLNIILTRSFNHYGKGQENGFVVSDFASAIAKAEKGSIKEISVEGLDVYRDFTDVRDIVSAYRLLMEKGKPGEVYNVGSGKMYLVRDILNELISFSHIQTEITIKGENIRQFESTCMCCNNEKLVATTGWSSKFYMHDGLREILDWWRKNI